MLRENSAGAVIFRSEGAKRYYLLLHYEAGHWDLVKGSIERGEQDKDAVIRETKEETGIDFITFVPGFKEKLSYVYIRDGDEIHKEVVFYLAETKKMEVNVSWEHRGYQWLTYEKALNRITYDTAKKIIERADNFLNLNGK
ncbi:MAG: NUDIX domain-containing protein [Candidatus Woesearchaeota archaeon]|nr:NUDIX domain-containing protein [Candidatus Woesearchaeota archaeon]